MLRQTFGNHAKGVLLRPPVNNGFSKNGLHQDDGLNS